MTQKVNSILSALDTAVPDEIPSETKILVPQSSYVKNTAHWQVFRNYRVKPTKKKREEECESRHGKVVIQERFGDVRRELQRTIVRQKTMPNFHMKSFIK